MRASLEIDEALLNEANEITGLPTQATVEEALRRLVSHHQRMMAWEELRGMGWDDAHHSRPTFETLASEFRALTASRHHTPSEVLLREGRDER